MLAVVDDDYLRLLGSAVTGSLGGRVGIAPRLYLKKLVAEVLDRVELYPDFDPRRDYRLTVVSGELTEVEANAGSGDPDEVELPARPARSEPPPGSLPSARSC